MTVRRISNKQREKFVDRRLSGENYDRDRHYDNEIMDTSSRKTDRKKRASRSRRKVSKERESERENRRM